MSLKRSCFKTVIKSDIKRLWWISVLVALFMLLMITVPLAERVERQEIYYGSLYRTYDNVAEVVYNGTMNYYIFAGLLGAFLSLGLFSYLSHVSSVTFNHSLPIKRSGLFCAHTVSAAMLIAFPLLVNWLVLACTVWGTFTLKMLLVNIGIYFVYAFLFYTVFTFVGMLTGNTVSQAVFSCVLILLPLFLTAFTITLCDDYLYGFTGSNAIEDLLIEYLYLSPESLETPKVLVYIFLIAAFFVLSGFVYNKRHLENYGEVIAFPNLRGLFKVSFGICSGILGYYYCQAFWNMRNILVMLVFGSLGVIIANMLSNKSFSLKGSKKPILYNAVFVALLIVIFNFDITGFEKRVPDVNSVKSVRTLEYEYDGIEYTYINDTIGHGRVDRTDYYTPVFTQKADILRFVEFHKDKVEEKVGYSDNYRDSFSGLPYSFRIEYTLKNGKKLTRSYVLNGNDKAFLEWIIESPQHKKYRYPVLDETQKNYTMVQVINYEYGDGVGDKKVFTPSDKEMKLILEAIETDRRNQTFEEYMFRQNCSATPYEIEVSYQVPAIHNRDRMMAEISDRYNVTVFDKNTIEALENAGCIENGSLLAKDKIVKITTNVESLHNDGIEQYVDYEEYEYVVAESSKTYSEISRKYISVSEHTDKEEIANICGYIESFKPINPFISERFVRFSYTIQYDDGHTRYMSFYDNYENVPYCERLKLNW